MAGPRPRGKESTVIIALLVLGWVVVLVMALSLCHMSALADRWGRAMFRDTSSTPRHDDLRKAA
jgi:hypothetical protein